ncbi:hypothetical protein MTO96_046250 [Rhipicephalus appendiculatus]
MRNSSTTHTVRARRSHRATQTGVHLPEGHLVTSLEEPDADRGGRRRRGSASPFDSGDSATPEKRQPRPSPPRDRPYSSQSPRLRHGHGRSMSPGRKHSPSPLPPREERRRMLSPPNERRLPPRSGRSPPHGTRFHGSAFKKPCQKVWKSI